MSEKLKHDLENTPETTAPAFRSIDRRFDDFERYADKRLDDSRKNMYAAGGLTVALVTLIIGLVAIVFTINVTSNRDQILNETNKISDRMVQEVQQKIEELSGRSGEPQLKLQTLEGDTLDGSKIVLQLGPAREESVDKFRIWFSFQMQNVGTAWLREAVIRVHISAQDCKLGFPSTEDGYTNSTATYVRAGLSGGNNLVIPPGSNFVFTQGFTYSDEEQMNVCGFLPGAENDVLVHVYYGESRVQAKVTLQR